MKYITSIWIKFKSACAEVIYLFNKNFLERNSHYQFIRSLLDKTALVKQIRNDMRDDWFPDPYFYNDMLEDNLVNQYFETHIEKNKNKYLVNDSTIYNIPKPSHSLRYAIELGFADRCMYHILTAHLIPYFDKYLPWSVFSHRYDYIGQRSSEKYLFHNGIDAWNHFTNSIKVCVTDDKYLLSTDLSNYFDNINLEILRETLIELIPLSDASLEKGKSINKVINELVNHLKAWSPRSSHGIPQNRDASSFLANIYMRKLDMKMDECYPNTYFRYMDDIKIVCSNEFEARHALKKLSLGLRELGLSINTKKTGIFPTSNKQKLNEHLASENEHIQIMESFYKKKTRESLVKLLIKAKERCLELIEEEKIDSREFRYCINKLIKLSSAKDLYIPEHFFYEIKKSIVSALIKLPSSTDQYTNFLKSVPTTSTELVVLSNYIRDKSKAIYTWQNYRLWLLFAYKRFENLALIDHAIQLLHSTDSADRAGAMIYIGAVGTEEQKIKVAEQFESLHTFIGQRCGLIACHELNFHDQIKTYITPYLREDLKGVYKSLRRNDRKGKYIIETKLEPLLSMEDEGLIYA